ncbi:MAG: hypothetical protein QOD68_684 [Actinomycetota bacterium]|jgi:cytoskeletal protein RodZ|nr:hypothetical protein [Actinomycetota bacterium]
MLALGLLFILAAAAVTAGAIYDGGEAAKLQVFGLSIENATIAGVFLAGVLTMLVFMLGLWMMFAAVGRSRRKRLARKETTARQRESVSEIEEERARLRAENERLQEQVARDTRPATPSGTTAAGAAAVDETRVDGGPTARPDTVAADPAVSTDHVHNTQQTDLTGSQATATSTSGRHRDEI